MYRLSITFGSRITSFVCLFVWFLTSSSTTRLYRGRAPRQERLTISRAATHETELGDHDFCLSRSHYTDTDPTCRERAANYVITTGTVKLLRSIYIEVIAIMRTVILYLYSAFDPRRNLKALYNNLIQE